MNDKDKKAFMDWLVTKLTGEDQEYIRKGEISPYFKPSYKNGKPDINEAWQAACEYMQKEIDDLKGQIKSCIFVYEEKVNRLIAENKKLREALEFYADSAAPSIAKEALKEIEE
jgi:hypothetical protein